jgi:O-antigen ligase
MTTDALSKYSKSLFAILLLFAFCLPWSKTAASAFLIIAYAVLIVAVIRVSSARSAALKSLRQPMFVPFMIVLCVSALGMINTENTAEGVKNLMKMADLPLVYFMVVMTIGLSAEQEHRKSGETALLAFIAGVAALDLAGMLQFLGIVGHARFELPLTPLNVHHIWFANVNAIAAYAAFSLFVHGGWQTGSRKRTTLILFSALALLSIVLSQARSVWLAMAVVGSMLVFLHIKKKAVALALIAGCAAGCFVLYKTVPFVHEHINAAQTDIVSYGKDPAAPTSLGDRLLMWRAASRMFLEHPFLGAGTGDYTATIAKYVDEGLYPAHIKQYNQPHNMYLFALAVNGIAGLAALLFVFVRLAQSSWIRAVGMQDDRLFAVIAIAVGVHCLIAGMFDSLLSIFLLRYAFALIMGISVCTFASVADKPHSL